MPSKFCAVCDRRLSSIKLLKYHLNIHKGYYAYFCQQCNQLFLTKSGTEKHKLLHKKLDDSDVVLGHRERNKNTRNPDNLYVCNECGEIYYTEKLLCKHIEKHLKPLSYQCDFCSKTFSSQDSLNGHRGMHKGKRKLLERRQLNRTRHLRSNKHCPLIMNKTKESIDSKSKCFSTDTIMCSLCKREFSSLDKFCLHESIHRCLPHHCLACKLTFRTNTQLHSQFDRCERLEISDTDVKQTTDQLIWPCDICGRNFDSVPVLKEHRKSHKKRKPFKCIMCPRAFLFLEEKIAHAKCHFANSSWANLKI